MQQKVLVRPETFRNVAEAFAPRLVNGRADEFRRAIVLFDSIADACRTKCLSFVQMSELGISGVPSFLEKASTLLTEMQKTVDRALFGKSGDGVTADLRARISQILTARVYGEIDAARFSLLSIRMPQAEHLSLEQLPMHCFTFLSGTRADPSPRLTRFLEQISIDPPAYVNAVIAVRDAFLYRKNGEKTDGALQLAIEGQRKDLADYLVQLGVFYIEYHASGEAQADKLAESTAAKARLAATQEARAAQARDVRNG